jgi:hypothetical protein
MKRSKSKQAFHFLGYKIEYNHYEKRWFVIDWDYEESRIVARCRTKEAAMQWCEYW